MQPRHLPLVLCLIGALGCHHFVVEPGEEAGGQAPPAATAQPAGGADATAAEPKAPEINNGVEAKSVESKSVEPKNVEPKSLEAKGPDTKEADAKGADVIGASATSAEPMAAEVTAADVKADDGKGANVKTAEAKGVDVKEAEARVAKAPNTHMPVAAELAAKDHPPAVAHEDEGNGRCWSIYADFLYMTVRGENVPFAQIRDDVGPLAVPRGPVGYVDPHHTPGFRLGAGRLLGEQNELHVRFSWWQTGADSHLEVPAGDPFVIHALTTFPTTINAAADSLTADAHLDMQQWIADVDLKRAVCDTESSIVNLVLGVRYAHLDQDFHATYSLLGTTDVTTRIDFDGFGPRLGIDGSFGHRVFVYGRSDVSLLFGHFGAKYLQENVFSGVQAQTQLGDDRVVPVWETELGVGWRSQSGRVEVMAGYTAAFWFNTMTTSSWIDGVQQSAFSTSGDSQRETLTFDGFFLRLGFNF